MRIAVVDDDKLFVEKLKQELEKFFRGKEEEAKIFCLTGGGLLDCLERQNNYDLYLLDIEMPGMDGMALAKEIRNKEADARIVFVTSYERYAVMSYRVRAYDYILKDSCRKDLTDLLERVSQEEEEKQEEYYSIQSESRGYKIYIDRILYLTKENQYTLFHCLDGMVYRERGTLESIYKRLPEEKFLFIDKGTIVNIKHIIQFENLEVTMKNKEVLPISRRAKSAVQERMANYWGRKM